MVGLIGVIRYDTQKSKHLQYLFENAEVGFRLRRKVLTWGPEDEIA